MIRNELRNVAIIAHVDHGKTTLVNEMLKQGGVFQAHENVADRVMDSNAIERERGITILSKNASIDYKGVKINIVDTPGHADFGGEVERVLGMVNGVLLLVDSFEGPMPQTRFVLQKALEMGLKVIIVVNKLDRPDARPDEIGDEVLELFLNLDANEEQFDSPIIYASGRGGYATEKYSETTEDLTPLFDKIISYIDPPEGDEDGPLQMLVSSIDYDNYVGKIASGRIVRGSIKVNKDVMIADYHNEMLPYKEKITKLFTYEGMSKKSVESAKVGDIVAISGIAAITIGDTICDIDTVEPLPFQKISEPTVEMTFSVNDSPFAGREGKFLTSRDIKERLYRETLKDVSLKVADGNAADSFVVSGRGEMHISILIENMRREGYELQVSTPRVLYKEDEDGKTLEPMERLIVDVPAWAVGSTIEKIGRRKGELIEMLPVGDRTKIEFVLPARGLFGYRGEFLTDTKGEGILNTIFDGYAVFKGEIDRRKTGSLIAFETGEATTYGLHNAQDRGTLFIKPGTKVYAGMVVGESPRSQDIEVNVCRKKHITNVRASGTDEALRLNTPKIFSLEECLEFIDDDELIEITPENLRIRKSILDSNKRKRSEKNK